MVNKYKGLKVFVTGHTGFKGAWLCEMLLSLGADVTGYSHKEYELFEMLDLKSRMKSIIGDIRDRDFLDKSIKEATPDIIFHLAAQPLVRYSYDEPVETFEVNVMGTVNIMNTLRTVSSVKSFVNVTTDKVYRNNEWCWGYREHEELCGNDPYSNSKSCSELVTYSFMQSFFEDKPVSISTARAGNVIGGGDFSKDRIMPDCLSAHNRNEEIIIRNPNSTRPYQHVLDCLGGYIQLGIKQYFDSELKGNYNFGPNDADCITTEMLVQKFCEYCGDNQSYKIQGDGGPHEARFLKLDCSKAKTVLGWNPAYNVDTAIKLCIEWDKSLDKKEITKIQVQDYLERI